MTGSLSSVTDVPVHTDITDEKKKRVVPRINAFTSICLAIRQIFRFLKLRQYAELPLLNSI